MNMQSLLPPALMLAYLAGLIGVVSVIRQFQKKPDRRSPLTQGLLRPPGHALSERLRDTQWDVAAYLAVAMAMPLMLYALYLQHRVGGESVGTISVSVLACTGLASLGYVAWRLGSALKAVRNLTLGWEAEVAAAEEINRLMHRGCLVFHDMPAGNDFNMTM